MEEIEKPYEEFEEEFEEMLEDPRLEWAKTAKPGDIINDCRYLNIKIKTMTPELYEGKIYDYDLVFEDGSGCSLTGCCNLPLTDDEIKESLREIEMEGYDVEESIKWVMENPLHNHIE